MKSILARASVFALIVQLNFCFGAYSQSAFRSDAELIKQADQMLGELYSGDRPGATVLISKYGDIIYRKAFGMANLELGVRMRPDMIFEVGSITKQFTAIAILQLVERGQINLDDEITKFVPDYPMRGFSITIHHLLTHTSGIASYTVLDGWESKMNYSPRQFIDFFKNQAMDFAPGESYQYNNSAYYLLGYIIEEVSGYSYIEYLQKNIFDPLRMKDTYYSSKTKTIKNRALGYQLYGNVYINTGYITFTPPYAAGALMMNIDDLFKWHVALHAGRVVGVEFLDNAFTDKKLNDGSFINYGYGWSLKEINGSPTYEHPGGIWGYAVNQIYLPEEDVSVIVFTNCDCNPPVAISTKLAALAINKPYNRILVELNEDELIKFIGVYDFGDGTTRTITLVDGQLYSQRSGQSRYEIFAYDKNKFFFKDSFTTLEFSEGNKGGSKGVITRTRSNWEYAQRNDNLIRKQIYLSEAALKKFIGIYKLKNNFYVIITLENGHLMTQATGQDKLEIFPQSEFSFFFKAVHASVDFVYGNGRVNKLVLTNAGQTSEAIKIE